MQVRISGFFVQIAIHNSGRGDFMSSGVAQSRTRSNVKVRPAMVPRIPILAMEVESMRDQFRPTVAKHLALRTRSFRCLCEILSPEHEYG